MKQYADFSGKTTVSEYWLVFLANVIIGTILGALIKVIPAFGVIDSIISIALIVPGLAIFVRRMNDCGRS